MKLPWIRLPTSAGCGTETPTSKPSMIRPRRIAVRRVDHEARGPAGLAAVDDHARLARCCRPWPWIELGVEVIRIGSPSCCTVGV